MRLTEYSKITNIWYDQRECSICLESYEPDDKVSELACHHIFHRACLKERKACPNCLKVEDHTGSLRELESKIDHLFNRLLGSYPQLATRLLQTNLKQFASNILNPISCSLIRKSSVVLLLDEIHSCLPILVNSKDKQVIEKRAVEAVKKILNEIQANFKGEECLEIKPSLSDIKAFFFQDMTTLSEILNHSSSDLSAYVTQVRDRFMSHPESDSLVKEYKSQFIQRAFSYLSLLEEENGQAYKEYIYNLRDNERELLLNSQSPEYAQIQASLKRILRTRTVVEKGILPLVFGICILILFLVSTCIAYSNSSSKRT